MRRRIYQTLFVSKRTGDVGWWFDAVLITLISLNILAIIFESVESFHTRYEQVFRLVEWISVIFFTLEYILRVWTANEIPRYARPVTGNLKYMSSPMTVIDLLAIMPFYLPLLGLDLRFLRVFRLLRLFRIFKLVRYIKALKLISLVIRDKREELVISIVFTIFLLLVSSTLMYYIENEAQPEHFASIPDTMWWGITTLTTVGYGDVYPVTPVGRLLGGLISILGIGLFALPTGILASGFSEQMTKSKKKQLCPHCGHELHQ